MRRLFLTASLLAALSGALLPTGLLADPGGPNLQQPIALTCTGGQPPVTVNPGTATNRGRVAWVVDSNSVFVTAYLAFSDGTDTIVLFDSKPGLKNLITCTGDAGGGFTVIATGFFTPR
jgi:ABC-type transport system substrate-binding protein